MSDLIDRQAAIDYFVTNVGFHDEDGYPIEDECELREIWTGYFDGIPPAQPKRIKGHWIEKPHVHGVAYCSLCDYELHTNDTNFCPNCGAEMEVTA